MVPEIVLWWGCFLYKSAICACTCVASYDKPTFDPWVSRRYVLSHGPYFEPCIIWDLVNAMAQLQRRSCW